MIIEVKDLKKSFKDKQAVKNLSFGVKEGSLFAFLGINGAGKSTTINIICGQLEKDSGKVYLDGKDIDTDINNIKGKIGAVFQNSVLDGVLTVKDNLEVRASLYGIYGAEFKKRLNELSAILDFKSLLKQKVSTLSGGQRRRIDVARALLHKPKILILDEPTTGLDPQTRQRLWNVFDMLRKEEGLTIFLTTHYMEETANADYVVIIDEGEKIAEGTPLELKNRYSKDYIIMYNTTEDDVKKLGQKFTKNKNSYKIMVNKVEDATKLIISYPEIFKDYEIIKGGMDDVFLNATGKDLGGNGFENA